MSTASCFMSAVQSDAATRGYLAILQGHWPMCEWGRGRVSEAQVLLMALRAAQHTCLQHSPVPAGRAPEESFHIVHILWILLWQQHPHSCRHFAGRRGQRSVEARCRPLRSIVGCVRPPGLPIFRTSAKKKSKFEGAKSKPRQRSRTSVPHVCRYGQVCSAGAPAVHTGVARWPAPFRSAEGVACATLRSLLRRVGS
jgi:hypothetical protein